MADLARGQRDAAGRTVLVALGVSLACSIVVATAAISLRPYQKGNRLANQQRVILQVAGVYEPGIAVARQFEKIEPRMVDLATGDYVVDLSAVDFDAQRAAQAPGTGLAIPRELDVAGIGRRATLSPVYLVRADGRLRRVVLPVSGKGLWSTLYGYVALEADGNTVYALRFHEHGETPGLGDKIDAPEWLAGWSGKQVYDEHGDVALRVVKGVAATTLPAARYEIDGLSGATLTANGVSNTLRYWFGEHGFAPYLARYSREDGSDE